MSAAFATTLLVGLGSVVASVRGYGRAAFVVLSGLFLLSSWLIFDAETPRGTDGQAMMWGVMLMAYVFSVILMFALRKRSDAIF